MIEIEFGGGDDPRVWYNGEELTSRCVSFEILPMRKARIHMYALPYQSELRANHIGCVGHLRREVIEDTYLWWVEEKADAEA
jgi:hypothetical protein